MPTNYLQRTMLLKGNHKRLLGPTQPKTNNATPAAIPHTVFTLQGFWRIALEGGWNVCVGSMGLLFTVRGRQLLHTNAGIVPS